MKRNATTVVSTVFCLALAAAGVAAAGVDRYAASTRTCESVINDDVKQEFRDAKSIEWDWNSVTEHESSHSVTLRGQGSYKGKSGRGRTFDFECVYDTRDDRVASGWWQSSFDGKRHAIGSGSSSGGSSHGSSGHGSDSHHGSGSSGSSGSTRPDPNTPYPLRDLIGVRASSAESQMKSRGYRWVRTDKSGDSIYSYWRESRTDKCVSVRTYDGEYDAILYTPAFDCGDDDNASAGDDEFDTVCGVERDGRTYRYRCHLRNEGCNGGGTCKTRLEMPDNAMTIVWGHNGKMEVEFDGMRPRSTTASFRDGQTRFRLDDATYFVYRTPDRAERELAELQD